MTKYLFSVLFALLLCNMTQAQNTVVKINPLSLAFLTANVAVEHAVSDKMSVQLGAAFGGFKFGAGDLKTSYTGFSVVPEFRYYVTKHDAPKGFFVGPYGVYRSYTTKQTVNDLSGGTSEAKSKLSIAGGGLNLGYQFLFDSGFALELFMGPCYGSSKSKVVTGSEEVSDADLFSGVGLRTGMTLGWAF